MNQGIVVARQGGPLTNTVDMHELQIFQKRLAEAPEQESIRYNKRAKNKPYLPISFIQMKLDELFFGHWEWKNVTTLQIWNEITVSGELHFRHPVTGEWLVRNGTGAAMIQFKSGTDVAVASNKILNTITKDYPHAEAEALKNAAKKIGPVFGRDLGRDEIANFQPDWLKAEIMEDLKAQSIATLEHFTEKLDVEFTDAQVLYDTAKTFLQDAISAGLLIDDAETLKGRLNEKYLELRDGIQTRQVDKVDGDPEDAIDADRESNWEKA